MVTMFQNSSGSPGTLPVVVFIHGSAFTKGSSNSKLYTPDFLVNASIVLVAMNFRLGSLGWYLCLGSERRAGAVSDLRSHYIR